MLPLLAMRVFTSVVIFKDFPAKLVLLPDLRLRAPWLLLSKKLSEELRRQAFFVQGKMPNPSKLPFPSPFILILITQLQRKIS